MTLRSEPSYPPNGKAMRWGSTIACLLLFAVATTRGAAQEPPAHDQTKTILSIAVDNAGDAMITLHLTRFPSNPPAIEKALGEAFAAPLQEIGDAVVVNGWAISARCRRALPRRGLVFAQSFDF